VARVLNHRGLESGVSFAVRARLGRRSCESSGQGSTGEHRTRAQNDFTSPLGFDVVHVTYPAVGVCYESELISQLRTAPRLAFGPLRMRESRGESGPEISSSTAAGFYGID